MRSSLAPQQASAISVLMIINGLKTACKITLAYIELNQAATRGTIPSFLYSLSMFEIADNNYNDLK